jgi:hypothetical protein
MTATHGWFAMSHARAYDRRDAVALVVACLLLFSAMIPARVALATSGPDYSYWFALAQSKVYPSSGVPAGAPTASSGAQPVMALGAAKAEFEGRQIAIHAYGTALHDVWIQPSDLTLDTGEGVATIPASNVSAYKVWYVNVTRPSYPFKRTGLEPDPLLPMTLANGQRLGWRPGTTPDYTRRGVPANTTQPFYVLFKVPSDATPGTYSGCIRITTRDDAGNPAQDVTIPVQLTVYAFSVQHKTLKTAFGLDLFRLAQNNSAAHNWLQQDPNPGPAATRVPERTTYWGDQLAGWMTYLGDHRITPQTMLPVWQAPAGKWAPPTTSGEMVARPDVREDYLGTGEATTFSGEKLQFNTVKMPENGAPAWVRNPFASKYYTAKAAQYYRTMRDQLGPYASRAYVYVFDEPHENKRKAVEKYAAFIHRYVPGVKVLLTADNMNKKKLVRGVDIYVNRLQFFFRDSKWPAMQRKARKEVWIYSHGSSWQGQVPLYLIDKPLADSRAMGWFAWRTRASGILYWNINSWRQARNSNPRDPYADTASGYSKVGRANVWVNGDGCLVYPGYYPALGLYVEGSPPVGSLRMEALRDGLEDNEYLQQVSGRFGTAAADAYVSRIIGAVPRAKSGRLQFPPYTNAPEPYEAVRSDMAARLSH